MALTYAAAPGPVDHRLAEVTDVEDADGLAHRGVLLHDAGGVLERHRPATELGELRAERDVPVVQGGRQERGVVGHGAEPTAGRGPCRPGGVSCPGDDLHLAQRQPRQDPRRRGRGRDRPAREGRRGRAGRGGRRQGVRSQAAAPARHPRATGKAGEVPKVPTSGTIASPLRGARRPRTKVDIDQMAVRRAAGAAARAITNAASVAVALPSDSPALVRAVTEGYVLGAYTFTSYKKESSAPTTRLGGGAQRGRPQAGDGPRLRGGPGRRRRGDRDPGLGQHGLPAT